MPWYEIFLVGAGLSSGGLVGKGGFVRVVYRWVKAKVDALRNEPDSE